MFKKHTLPSALLSALAVAGLTSAASAAPAAPFKFNTAAEPAVAGAPASRANPLLPTGPAGEGGEFRKMAASQYDLFFGGEFDSRTLSFFALPDEASTASQLVLSLQTAISAAPERSKLAVTINGKDVGTTSLVAGDPRRIVLDIPAGIIQPGYNAVRFSADHRHRVDCSIDATYELWTKIDPEKSGFVFSGARSAQLSMIDLLPLAGTANGRTNLRVVLPAGADMTAYDRALSVVQALTIAGNFNHPQVEFATTPGEGPGIDIYVGTARDIAGLPGNVAAQLVSGEGFTVAPGATSDRKRLIISGGDVTDLAAKTRDFIAQATSARPVGTPEGLAALSNMKGRLLVPGDTVTLNELGYTAQPFDGRYENSKVNFTMPSDFYPGAYSSMNFHLSALYVGGLDPNAELTVKANDKVVANIPLGSALGGTIRDQRLPIPFTALRPGQNTLQIEARLPSELDAACETVDKATSTVRLSIDGDSYLDIPTYARVGRYPDIAAVTSGLQSALGQDAAEPTSLLVPNYNRQSIDAAATFVAKMAYASGEVKPVQYTAILPTLETRNLIAFGAYDTLPSELVTGMNLDLVNLREMAGSQASPFEVAALGPFGAPNETQRQVTDALTGGAIDLGRSAGSFLTAPVERSTAVIHGLRSKLSEELVKLDSAALRTLLGKDVKPPRFAPTAEAAFLVAQDMGRNGGLWTVVASKSAHSITTGTDILTDVTVWNKLGGAVQTFSETGTTLDQKAGTNQHLFQTQSMSLSNIRLVAASWLANNAGVYIIALLTAAMLLGLGTYMVLVTGRRTHG